MIFNSQEEETNLLLQKIEAFDIRGHEDQIPLLLRLNDIRPPTRSLSNEVLTEIICRIVDDKKSRCTRPQLIIAAVSSHWQAVASNTPKLWTTIKWNFFTTFTGGYGPLLEICLDGSGSLLVSIEFSADESGRMEEDDRNMFLEITSMPQYMPKIQGLHHFHVQLLPLLPRRLAALHRLLTIPVPTTYDLASVVFLKCTVSLARHHRSVSHRCTR